MSENFENEDESKCSSKTKKRDFSELAERWSSPIVAREKVGEFSGGLLNPRTMANIDSLGSGPKMVRLGRKRGYWVDSLVDWMNSRVDEKEGTNLQTFQVGGTDEKDLS